MSSTGIAARLAPWKWWIMALAVLAGVYGLMIHRRQQQLPVDGLSELEREVVRRWVDAA